ncbi:unnamed protein product [Discula destructiva]
MRSFSRSAAAVVGAFAVSAGVAVADEYPLAYVTDYQAYNDGFYGIQPNQSYRSTPTLGPLFQVNQWNRTGTGLSRYLFLSSGAGHQRATPYIIDTKDLSLVYAQPQWASVNNPRIQMYQGVPYFTYWEGDDFSGHGLGYCLLYDSSYKLAYNISTKMINTRMDSHECQLTDDGTALVSAYERIAYDMSDAPGGGPVDGVLLDSIFEEIDVATGELKFLWRASHHFSIRDTEVNWGSGDYGAQTVDVGWDFFHINSLQKTKQGNYLVSGRRINTVTLISGQDGSVIWKLGGKHNQFADLSAGQATNFGFQHTARFLNDNMTELTLFDNHDLDPEKPSPLCPHGCSRGLHLRLNFDDPTNFTAEVVHEYYHPMSISSWAMGGYQTLPNGNVLIGWGTTSTITEYTEDGQILLDMQVGPWFAERHNQQPVYRAWTMDWVASPTWLPDIAAADGHAYVSWNGATEVDSWDIHEGPSQDNITFTTNAKKVGFETVIPLKTNGAFVVANALDADGNVLATSDVWDMELGATRPGGAVGFCAIGCDRFDSVDSMVLLLMSASAVLVCVMAIVTRNPRRRSKEYVSLS